MDDAIPAHLHCVARYRQHFFPSGARRCVCGRLSLASLTSHRRPPAHYNPAPKFGLRIA